MTNIFHLKPATTMTIQQACQSAVRCALADLIGAYQDWKMKGKPDSFHDWSAHLQSIDDLAYEFDLQHEIPDGLA